MAVVDDAGLAVGPGELSAVGTDTVVEAQPVPLGDTHSV